MSTEGTHTRAMELVDEAEGLRRQGNERAYISALREALTFESAAANAYLHQPEQEPTRSVLFRSAASIAVELKEWRQAEQLIAAAMYGEPPHEIAEELRDLLETVNFRRHLELRGFQLSESEFQMSLAGRGVGFGIALSNLFVERVSDMELLVRRTAERVSQKPFRERGRMSRAIQEDFSLFVSVPRPGSFAVTFQVGSSTQISIPGEDMGGKVVNEVVDCLETLQNAGENELASRINDEAYFRNFIALARKIAPDGKDIASVGFTAQTKNRERKFTFSVPRERILPVPAKTKVLVSLPISQYVTVTGLLKFADARNESAGIIDLIDDQNVEHKVIVPSGMMSDIVKPMFGERVTVSGRLDSNGIALDKIDVESK